MEKPRPVVEEAWVIGVCRGLQAFATFFAASFTLILAINTVLLVRAGDYGVLALSWALSPLFYAFAAAFFLLPGMLARRIEKDVQQFGEW